MVQGGVNTVQVPAADPDGDDFTFSLGTIAGSGGSYSPPAGMSISSSGLLSWDTSNAAVGQLYTVRIVISEDDNASAVELDFFVSIVDGTINTSPTAEVDPLEVHGHAHAYILPVGQPFNIDIVGTDLDGDVLTVSNQGLPPGATLSPTSGASPLTTTFSWTPSAADAGNAYAVLVIFTDTFGSQALASLSISVPSNQPPVASIDAVDPVTCALSSGASVTLSGAGSDPDGDLVSLAWSAGSSASSIVFDDATSSTPTATFPVGTTTVTLTVTDPSGATGTATVDVTVIEDTTPPVITLATDGDGNTDLVLECSPDASYVELSASVADDCDPNPALAISGTVDATTLGEYTITYTATDANGNTSQATRTVSVVDTTPPELSFSVEASNLWPPNHKMHLVVSGVTAADVCDTGLALEASQITVSSNEAINDKGDGNTDYDYEIVETDDGTFDVYVRSERDGRKSGRTYTIEVSVADGSGNTSDGSWMVDVDKSQGRGKVVAAAASVEFGVGNHPNPFNPTTVISYSLPAPSDVQLTIHNILGQQVQVLAVGSRTAGVHSVEWDGRNAAGNHVAPGMYIYRLTAGPDVAVGKMVLAK